MNYMNISKMLDSAAQYIIEAMTRIFSPNDDAYPAVGTQPFTGEPYKHRRHTEW
jgi:hypothetical protein